MLETNRYGTQAGLASNPGRYKGLDSRLGRDGWSIHAHLIGENFSARDGSEREAAMTGYTLLGVTPRLEELIRDALMTSEGSLRAELSLWSQSDRDTISFQLVQRAHKQSNCRYVCVCVYSICSHALYREYLHQVLMGSVVCLPEYHPPARVSQLIGCFQCPPLLAHSMLPMSPPPSS